MYLIQKEMKFMERFKEHVKIDREKIFQLLEEGKIYWKYLERQKIKKK